MSSFDSLQKESLHSELMVQQHLKSLRETLKQQLEETQRKQTEELERRIQRNAVLCTDERQSANDKDKRSESSISKIIISKQTKTLSSSVVPSTNKNNKDGHGRTPHCERFGLSKSSQQCKEEEAEAECRKKFCAIPVPDHIHHQPAYQEMIELREKERKQGHEERIQFLVSTQKPFSFQHREKEKREKLKAEIKEDVCEQKNVTHKKIKDSSGNELKDPMDKVHSKQGPTAAAVKKGTPSQTSRPKVRIADRTWKEKLGFLDEKPSFNPKIIQQVPDFNRLHKALQTNAQMKAEKTTGTKCQPFILRTAALPARKRMTSTENLQVPQRSHLYRSKSHGALTSLSADTLPTFITDAVRKRGMAIRKSMELRDSKNQESSDWLRNYQSRTGSMKSTVALHAKLLDPHSSLKEVREKNLHHHRKADQQRMRDYTRELQEIKARVRERPYLFQQVKQKCAKVHAEQIYQNKLKKAGLKEKYIEEIGQAFIPEDATNVTDHNKDQDIQSRAESWDDGEKIEDVEEKSV